MIAIVAFGAFARLSPSLEHLARGLELADSITCDGEYRLITSLAFTKHRGQVTSGLTCLTTAVSSLAVPLSIRLAALATLPSKNSLHTWTCANRVKFL